MRDIFKLTVHQSQFLAQGIDDIFLSVRTSNCLKSLEIKRLSDLVQYPASELLRIRILERNASQKLSNYLPR